MSTAADGGGEASATAWKRQCGRALRYALAGSNYVVVSEWSERFVSRM
jgi:hypothetical protein